jgi:hypothetical protein
MMASRLIFVITPRSFMFPNIGIKRLLTNRDETVFGINRNQSGKLRKYFTHT